MLWCLAILKRACLPSNRMQQLFLLVQTTFFYQENEEVVHFGCEVFFWLEFLQGGQVPANVASQCVNCS